MAKRVIVIGAGIVGASFAHHLADQGADVMIIDQQRKMGGTATPRSWAWINASWGNAEPYFRLRQEAMRLWRNLDKRVPGLNVNWCGGLLWDLPEKELLAYVRERAAQSYPVRVVDRTEAARIEPHLASYPDLAVHASGEGSVEPVHAVERLLAAAQAKGVDCVMETPVRWLVSEAGRITGVMTAEGTLQADAVVLAAGLASKELLEQLGITLALNSPPGLLVHTKPAPELLNGLVMAPELHVRQTAEGRLVAGSDFGGTDPGGDPERAARDLFAKMKTFIAGSVELQLDHYAIGYRPTPSDGVPAIGFVPGHEGLYLCVSHSGITLAPAFGQFGADEILKGERHELLLPFAPDRLLS